MSNEDTARISNELKASEKAISQCGANIKEFARREVEAHAAYESAKNQTLLRLFKEEKSADFIGKRTEVHRRAMYRTENEQLRDTWIIAKASIDSERDLLKVLTAQLMSVQARAKLLKTELSTAGYGT